MASRSTAEYGARLPFLFVNDKREVSGLCLDGGGVIEEL